MSIVSLGCKDIYDERTVLIAIVEGSFARGLLPVKGPVLCYETKTDFAPGGLTLIDNQLQRKGDVLLLTNDMLNAVRITPPENDTELTEMESSTAEMALEREQETLRSWIPMGVNVSKEAQALFDKFYKQLPKDTKWYNDGHSQDLLVLGVHVRHPYQGPDCCEAIDSTGQKKPMRQYTDELKKLHSTSFVDQLGDEFDQPDIIAEVDEEELERLRKERSVRDFIVGGFDEKDMEDDIDGGLIRMEEAETYSNEDNKGVRKKSSRPKQSQPLDIARQVRSNRQSKNNAPSVIDLMKFQYKTDLDPDALMDEISNDLRIKSSIDWKSKFKRKADKTEEAQSLDSSKSGTQSTRMAENPSNTMARISQDDVKLAPATASEAPAAKVQDAKSGSEDIPEASPFRGVDVDRCAEITQTKTSEPPETGENPVLESGFEFSEWSQVKIEPNVQPQQQNWIHNELPATCKKPGLLFYLYDAAECGRGSVNLYGKLGFDNKDPASAVIYVPSFRRHLYLHSSEQPSIGDEPDCADQMANEGKRILQSLRQKFADLVMKYDLVKYSVNVLPVWKCAVNKRGYSHLVRKKELYFELSWGSNYRSLIREEDLYLEGAVDVVVGSQTGDALTEFLIHNNIRGPQWMYIPNVDSDYTITASPNFEWYPVDKDIPHLVVTSISMKMLKSSETAAVPDILLVSCVTNKRLFGLGRTDSEIKPTHGIAFNLLYLSRPLNVPLKQFTKVTSSVKELLNAFTYHIQSVNPDIVCGHGLLSNIIPTLFHLHVANRTNSWNCRSSSGPLNIKMKQALPHLLFPGRLLCDTQKIASDICQSLTEYTLESLVTAAANFPESSDEFKLVKNIPNDSTLLTLFLKADSKSDADQLMKGLVLASYESFLTYKVLMHLQMLSLTLETSSIGGCMWNRALACQRAIRNEFLLMNFFHSHDYIWQIDREKTEVGTSANDTYTGGLVLDPVIGFHQNYVLYLDYASLYPSIIQEFNIDFTTVNSFERKKRVRSGQEPENGEKDADDDAGCDYDEPVNFASTHQKGILPTILEDLISRRRDVKKLLNKTNPKTVTYKLLDIRQRAIKLVSNSLYGSLGFKQFAFYSPGMASMITSWGRKILTRTKQSLENSFGCLVLYGDTDSLMIDSGIRDEGPGHQQYFAAHEKAESFIKEVNKHHSKLELEVECIFKNLLLLSKKKYAAVKMHTVNGHAFEQELIVKGLDIVRRDWCQLVRKIGYELLDMLLMKSCSSSDLTNHIATAYTRDKIERLPLEEFIINKTLVKSIDKYNNIHQFPHVMVASRLKKIGIMNSGQQTVIPYVICKEPFDGSGTGLGNKAYHPDEVKGLGRTIDFEYYQCNQLYPPILRILQHIPDIDVVRVAETFNVNLKSRPKTSPSPGIDDGDMQIDLTIHDEMQSSIPLLLEWSSGFVQTKEHPSVAIDIMQVPCDNCGQTETLDNAVKGACSKCTRSFNVYDLIYELKRARFTLERDVHQYKIVCCECKEKQSLNINCEFCGSKFIKLAIDHATYYSQNQKIVESYKRIRQAVIDMSEANEDVKREVVTELDREISSVSKTVVVENMRRPDPPQDVRPDEKIDDDEKKRERAEKFKRLKQRRTAASQGPQPPGPPSSVPSSPPPPPPPSEADIPEQQGAPAEPVYAPQPIAPAIPVKSSEPVLIPSNQESLTSSNHMAQQQQTIGSTNLPLILPSLSRPAIEVAPPTPILSPQRPKSPLTPRSRPALKILSKLPRHDGQPKPVKPILQLFEGTIEEKQPERISASAAILADPLPDLRRKRPLDDYSDASLSDSEMRGPVAVEPKRSSPPVEATMPEPALDPAPEPPNQLVAEGGHLGNEKHMLGVDDDENAQGAIDLYLDGKGQPVEEDYFTMLAKRGGTKDLEIPDHSKIEYDLIVKNLYSEAAEIRDMTEEEVDTLRRSHQIKVKPKWLCPRPLREFSQAGLSDSLLGKLYTKGVIKPFPVQMQVLPALMSGLNVLCVATTGSGKTLAYLIPMIRHCVCQPEGALKIGQGPRGLILVPTRELATQIGVESRRYGAPAGLITNVLYGGGRLRDQLSASKHGCDICVATPGRLIEILTLNGGRIMNLRKVHCVVLDEADRMFDMGFGPQIEKLVGNTRPDRQISLFSATFPQYMDYFAKSFTSKDVVEITIGGRGRAADTVIQHLEHFTFEAEKFLRLLKLLGEWYEHGESILIFCRNQESVENLFVKLLAHGYPAIALHGGQDQEEREMAILDFKKKTRTIMVATSLASRGIDVKNVVLVVNYDAPDHAQDYIHRIGRTGRAGNTGVAYTFFSGMIGPPPQEEEMVPPPSYHDGDKAHEILPIARENPTSVISPEVEKLAEDFLKQVESGERRLFKKKLLSGSGFSFDVSEKSQQQEAKEFWKKQLGIAPDDDADGAHGGNGMTPEMMEEQLKKEYSDKRAQELLDQWTSLMVDPIARDAKKKMLETTVQRVVEQELQRLELTGGLKEALEKYRKESTTVDASVPISATSKRKSRGSAIQQARRILHRVMAGASERRVPKDYEDEVTGEHVMYLGINDYPSQARHQVTQKDVLASISDSTGATINVKGRYIGPGGAQREAVLFELHLEIVAPTAISARMAKQQLLEIVETEAKKTLR